MKPQNEQGVNTTIERLLHLSEEQHCQMMLDSGNRWLEENFKPCPAVARRWKDSRIFWNWWVKQWSIINLEVIEELGFYIGYPDRPNQQQYEALQEAFAEKHKAANKHYPAKPIVAQIQKETQKCPIQDLLDGTGVAFFNQKQSS